jgi:hypothetical protein
MLAQARPMGPRCIGCLMQCEVRRERAICGMTNVPIPWPIVVRRKDTTAHAPDHRTMPPHQGGEGGIVPPGNEALQKFAIGHPRPVGQEHGPT